MGSSQVLTPVVLVHQRKNRTVPLRILPATRHDGLTNLLYLIRVNGLRGEVLVQPVDTTEVTSPAHQNLVTSVFTEVDRLASFESGKEEIQFSVHQIRFPTLFRNNGGCRIDPGVAVETKNGRILNRFLAKNTRKLIRYPSKKAQRSSGRLEQCLTFSLALSTYLRAWSRQGYLLRSSGLFK